MHAIVYYLLQHTPSETLSETPQGQIAPEVAGVRWDSDLMVRGLREGLRRHEFIAALQEEMSTFLNESLPLLQLNTADAYFSAMDSLVTKVAQRFFKRGVQDLLLSLKPCSCRGFSSWNAGDSFGHTWLTQSTRKNLIR